MSATASIISIRERVKARRDEEAQKVKGKEKKPGGSDGDGITPQYVRDCLKANELGDGLLFAALNQDKFIYNKSAAEWLAWQGHCWDRDLMDTTLSSVETVAQRYVSEASRIGVEIAKAVDDEDNTITKKLQKLQRDIFSRVTRLRSERGRTNCLKFAHTNTEHPLAVIGDVFDIDPWLIACNNGVIDLRTGEISDGRPGDYISKASPADWKGIEAPAPLWEKTLLEIFKDNADVVSYLQRLFGYAITGLNREHVLPILWGQGRNGKSMIVEIVLHVLGGLAAPIASEMLLDQGRVKSSAAPSPDIMALRGLRIAFASETDQGRRFSVSRVKWLSGGDTLTGRYPHDKHNTSFIPTHLLFLLTNHRPHAGADEFAFWERVHLIPFELSFVDREPRGDNERRVDKTLKERLLEEAPGILAWLVRGCLAWQDNGLKPPAAILNATAEYKRDEDLLADFIEECCFLDPDDIKGVKSTEIYDAFKTWFMDNVSKKSVISQKKFGAMMGKRFRREKHGSYFYYGLGLNTVEEEDVFSNKGPK